MQYTIIFKALLSNKYVLLYLLFIYTVAAFVIYSMKPFTLEFNNFITINSILLLLFIFIIFKTQQQSLNQVHIEYVFKIVH